MPNKGLTVYIYSGRWREADLSNGGVSNRYNSFVLTGPEVPEISEPNDEVPELRLEERGKRVIALQTEELRNLDHSWEFGGTFIYATGGPFPHDYPIPVYDRQESPATVSMNV